MSTHNAHCPHCGGIVEPTDTVCSNCWCDLRTIAPGPGMTQRLPVDNRGPANFPDTKLERTPLYSATQQEQAAGAPPPAPQPAAWRGPEAPSASEGDDGFGSPPPDKPAPRKSSPQPKAPPNASTENVMLFRPRLRPPIAILRVLDDDMKDGETIRIRTPDVVIGRSEGDVRLPHERMMSAKHAKISCRYENEHYRWFLTDLGSTNGTFLRIRSGKLEHNSEVLLGAYRYRFNANPQGKAMEPPPAAEPTTAPVQQTLGWKKVTPESVLEACASVIRVLPDGRTFEFKFVGVDVVVGADPSRASVRIIDDPMLNGAHVRIYQDEHRRWMIEDLDSRNGTWLSIQEKQIDMSAQFQLGEQRFSIRFP